MIWPFRSCPKWVARSRFHCTNLYYKTLCWHLGMCEMQTCMHGMQVSGRVLGQRCRQQLNTWWRRAQVSSVTERVKTVSQILIHLANSKCSWCHDSQLGDVVPANRPKYEAVTKINTNQHCSFLAVYSSSKTLTFTQTIHICYQQKG